jgi:hypothetical protein
MAVQVRQNFESIPFILSGSAYHKEAAIILTDGSRAAVLAPLTLMARVSASGKWTPWGDPTATDGTAIPKGIYVGDEITAAALVAADVVNCPIIVGGYGGLLIDSDQLVIEELTSPASDLDSVITVGTTNLMTCEEALRLIGIFCKSTVAIDGYENT